MMTEKEDLQVPLVQNKYRSTAQSNTSSLAANYPDNSQGALQNISSQKENSSSDTNGWNSYGSSQCADVTFSNAISQLTEPRQNHHECSEDKPISKQNISLKDSDAQDVTSNQQTKLEKPIKDRTNLRKGKWTVSLNPHYSFLILW